MTLSHEDYVKKRDEILTNLAIDMTNTTMPERLELTTKAQLAIDALVQREVRKGKIELLEELGGYFGDSYENEARAYEECVDRIAELEKENNNVSETTRDNR